MGVGTEDSSHILDQDEPGPECPDRVGHAVPEPGTGALAETGPQAGG